MGLDMCLTKETYIGARYSHNNISGKVELLKDGKPISIKVNRISEITEEVGYWRKANQIHNWFVANVQDGEDKCQKAYVSKEQLSKLLEIRKTIKAKCQPWHNLLRLPDSR